MTMPLFEDIMLPLLQFLEDRNKKDYTQVVLHLFEHFKLTQEEFEQKKPTGRNLFYNRIGWAKTHLTRAGLIKAQRGIFHITDSGSQILKDPPPRIDRGYLRQFETTDDLVQKHDADEPSDPRSPTDLINDGIFEINDDIAKELLKIVKSMDPTDFEKLSSHLIEKMGYGKSKHVGKPGDGGIDAKIYVDALGLRVINIQCKRYNNIVPTADVREFIGTLAANRMDGLFITTSDFSPDAYDKIKESGKNIVLINGDKLVKCMIDYSVGVKDIETIIIKKIDPDSLYEY